MPSPSVAVAVTVVGIGADGWAGMPPYARGVVAGAQVLVGGPRQLELVPAEVAAERVALPTPLLPALGELLTRHTGRLVVVLASGDPMHYGIGTTLVRLLGPERVVVVPSVSSLSLAAARLRWSLDDLDVVSVVGRPLALLHPALQPGRRLLVLVSEPTAAAGIRAVLDERGFAPSEVTVLSDLGARSEQVRVESGPAGQVRPHGRLTIVAVDCRADAQAPLLPRTPGLPDEAFDQDGQITKREVRAFALAALVPVPGQLLWDVGAGSGSIGIEWMRVHPASRAVAIEPRADRRERIVRNATRLGVPGLTVVAGRAPQACEGLPTPDAVFVGGGGTGSGVVEACWQALAPGGRLVANAVTIEAEHALVGWQRRLGGTLTRTRVERADALGRFTTWRPALPVVQWAVRKPAQEPPVQIPRHTPEETP